MREKIATAMVCLIFCLTTNTTSTAFAHNHQEVISEVTDANEMMIDNESVIDTLKNDSVKNNTQKQKSNQTHIVRRVTFYYPTGHKTATGHSAKGNEKIVSLSPDLLKLIPYHSVVEIEGYGTYTVEDRTASWVTSTADILIPRGTKIKNGRNVTIRVIN